MRAAAAELKRARITRLRNEDGGLVAVRQLGAVEFDEFLRSTRTQLPLRPQLLLLHAQVSCDIMCVCVPC